MKIIAQHHKIKSIPYPRASAEKFSGGRPTEKIKPENSTIKPPSTSLVACLKIQGKRPPSPRCRPPCPYQHYSYESVTETWNCYYFCKIQIYCIQCYLWGCTLIWFLKQVLSCLGAIRRLKAMEFQVIIELNFCYMLILFSIQHCSNLSNFRK